MRMLALGVALVVALPLSGRSGAPVTTNEEAHAAFVARLDEVQELLRNRRWDKGHDLLLTAVEEAGEEEFVLQHWSEIEEDLARCAFWKKYKAPKPKEVVGGELLSWKESSGAIKLRYRKGDPGFGDGLEDDEAGDFLVAREGVHLHPLVFKGPYVIEFECGGLSKSSLSADLPPSVMIDWPWGSLNSLSNGLHYLIACGVYSGIFEISDDGDAAVLETASTFASPSSLGFPFDVKVQVSASRISATVNGKTFKAKRPKSDFGQFGLVGFENIEELEISGKVEPSWIAGLIDDAVQADWTDFREDFEALEELPAWMKQRVEGKAEEGRDMESVLPVGASASDLAALSRLSELLSEGEIGKGESYLNSARDDLSETTAHWLDTIFHLYDGRLEAALDSSRLLSEKAPQFYEGRLLHAQLEAANGTNLDAAPLYEQLTLDFPFHLEPYEALATLSIVERRPDQAWATIGDAIANGVNPRALAPIERTIYRSKHGPQWGKAYTYESKHYIVSTDLSENVAWEIGQELEKFYKKYINRVRRPARSKDKFRVYFFSGLTGYADYTGDLLGDPAHGTLGLYSPWLKQLVIWNSAEKEMVMRTVRHEGFHQYLDVITSEAPVWFNEGMAEYYEQSKLVDGNWKDDQINKDHVALLRSNKKEWTPLRSFVYGDTRSFRLRQSLHYPQAWAVCHFLYNTTKENKEIAESLLDALEAGKGRREALDIAFDGVDFRKMERELKVYVDTLQ